MFTKHVAEQPNISPLDWLASTSTAPQQTKIIRITTKSQPLIAQRIRGEFALPWSFPIPS
jgi:hypothetical protein